MTVQRPERSLVYIDAEDLGGLRRVGALRPTASDPTAPIAFTYEPTWVEAPNSFVIDPTHYLDPSPQYPSSGQLSGVFSDTAPDRWGRLLLDYRESERARVERRKPRQLGEWDYLLGVNDSLRMGALRFAATDGGPFLDSDGSSVPPAAELRELENAARVIENPARRGTDEVRDALRHLLAPGSPMGGARPKTTFRDPAGELWMAKFPSHNDRRDMGAWEYTLNRLARKAGIEVPDTNLQIFIGPYHTFLARRFDRSAGGRRMFTSAMTLLGRHDRESSSYIEIAEAIEANVATAAIPADLEQLFRRLIFNILTGHRDDHLRNHGFLRSPEGWRLAPAYDLNPMPDKLLHELATGIGDRTSSVEVAITETAPFCRLTSRRAIGIAEEVRAAVRDWRDVARAVGLSGAEIDLVSGAFLEAGGPEEP